MPFGLCNAGATFQRLIDIVMAGLNLEICLVYLDDIVVFARTCEEHLERLGMVLERLSQAGLKLKPEKCKFFRRSVQLLGHVISNEGIGTDPEKTEAVANWPTPTTIAEVRSFVGLASCYRRFVRDFAKIASPLHELTKKDAKFHWIAEYQEAFERLKVALTTPPVFAMPNDDDDYVLDTDASDKSIGAVLSQQQNGLERVLAYASRSLYRRERNYCVTRKELLAIVHFLRYFKQYLLGRTFKVRTDHAALPWLRRTPDPIGQQARWLEQMEEFNFEVEHRRGVRHGNADALSRRPCAKPNCPCDHRQSRKLQERCEGHRGHLFDGPADQPIGDDFYVREAEVPIGEDGPSAVPPPEDHGDHLFDGPADRLVDDGLHVRAVEGLAYESTATEAPSDDDGRSDQLPPKEQLKAEQGNDPDIAYIYQLIDDEAEKPSWNDFSRKSHDQKVLWSF